MDFINGVKYARLFNIWPEIKGSAADFDLSENTSVSFFGLKMWFLLKATSCTYNSIINCQKSKQAETL